MSYHLVSPDDRASLETLVSIRNAAGAVDDPDEPPSLPEITARWLRYGWDLELGEHYLYTPEGASEPVGILDVDLPKRDNLQLAFLGVQLHPDHRRRGHGTAMMTHGFELAREAGRTIAWAGGVEGAPAVEGFLATFGFRYASHDARRKQVLADVDQAEVDRLYATAQEAAADYELVRLQPPTPDDVLESLVEVTAAINDAPMGTLTFEDEKFDLQRLKDLETAVALRGDRFYRIFARHRTTGEIGGHTFVFLNPLQPTLAGQGDTAVARQHRGHRLGLLLKIAMMKWLAEVEPQIESISTWNNADNDFMISVNEKIGYRLSNTFAMYEVPLDGSSADAVSAGAGSSASA